MNQFIYTLRRYATASVLNLLGFGISLTACYILLTQMRFAASYNECIEESENVYRLEINGVFGDNTCAQIPRPLAEQLAELPQVEECFCGQFKITRIGHLKKGEEFIAVDDVPVTNRCLRCVRPKMLCGVDTLETDDDCVIPASLAQKYFGETMVAGQSLTLANDASLRVVGVYEDFPENCILPNHIYASMGDECRDMINNFNFTSLIRLCPGGDIAAVEKAASQIIVDGYLRRIDSYSGEISDSTRQEAVERLSKYKVSLRPVCETYFSGVDDSDAGNAGMQLVLRIAILVLLTVAAINFANFTLAETPMRIRGVNTRKVLGMTNLQLRLGMIGETVFVALAAFLLSLGLDYLLSLSPWIGELTVGSIRLSDNLCLVVYLGLAALAIGIAVGIYPAFFATGFAPALVLKGSFGLSPAGKLLRQSLVCVQIFIAMTLTVYLGVLMLQSRFIFQSDYGFDKDEMVFCDNIAEYDRFDVYRSELEKVPGVESVGFTMFSPGLSSSVMTWIRGEGERQIRVHVFPCDWNYLRTIGINMVEGRDFSRYDGDVLIVNEAAKRIYQWIDIDKPMTDGLPNVIGICGDFRVLTAKQDNSQEVAAFLVFGEEYKEWRQGLYQIVVRVGKNIDKVATLKALDEKLRLMLPNGPVPKFRFMDERLQQTYEEEFRFIRQVEAFSLICLLVTLIGVFCLTMFETSYRRREIALRKVMGSSTSDIMRMFLRHYLALVIPAFVLAAPLAWLLSVQWLQNFAERTPLYWWLWPLGIALITLTVLATAAVQTWRVAREKPVEAIKGE